MIPRLHLVTDDVVLQQPGFVTTATRVLRALEGRVALHVRARAVPARTLFGIVSDLRAHAHWLAVNDRVDIAMTARADAVQLGARSLPIPAVRVMAGLTIGYSAHSATEAAAAERDGADFVFAGSIHPTSSHPDIVPAGLALLEATVAACVIPVLAIGGMTRERVPGVLKTGAHGVAVISAVWHAADPVQAAGQFAKLLEL